MLGVGKADTIEEVRALLPTIFRLDNQALLEPFVPNLVEYNLSVTRAGGAVRTSAIECPKRAEELRSSKRISVFRDFLLRKVAESRLS